VCAVREVVDRFVATSSVEVDLHVDPGLDQHLNDMASATAYRAVAEALTNVRRHACDTSRVLVKLTRPSPGELRLTVTNDGAPADLGGRPRSGFGLMGLTERVELLGGTLTAEPVPTGGWRLEMVLPI
jgi:signal transduction histidine kinase